MPFLNITYLNTQKKKIDTGLYIPNDKELFHGFEQHKDEFNAVLGAGVEFRDSGKSSRILLYKSINVKDRTKWPEAINWLFETSLKFKRIVQAL